MGQPLYKRRTKWKFPEYCSGDKSAWRNLSEECKRRDGYACTECGARGKLAGGTATLHAHHIVSKSRGGGDFLLNLKTICENCHKKEHPHMR